MGCSAEDPFIAEHIEKEGPEPVGNPSGELGTDEMIKASIDDMQELNLRLCWRAKSERKHGFEDLCVPYEDRGPGLGIPASQEKRRGPGHSQDELRGYRSIRQRRLP